MKRATIGVLAWVLGFVVCGGAEAGDLKVAVVDMAKVMESHPMGVSNRSVLRKQINDFEKEQEKLTDELMAMRDDFDKVRKEAGNKALSELARGAKLEKAEAKLVELREMESGIRERLSLRKKQISDQRVRMRRRMVKSITWIVKEYAEAKGYDLVLDSSGLGLNGVEGVLFAVDKIDITDGILEAVKKQEDEGAESVEDVKNPGKIDKKGK